MPVYKTWTLDETRDDPSLRPYKRTLPSPQNRRKLRKEGFSWVLSSNVSAIAERNDNLYVRFHNGSLYEYPDMGDKFDDMYNSNSKGRWVWNNLRRPNKPYQKIGSLPLDQDVEASDEDITRPPTRPSQEELREVEELTAANLALLEASDLVTIATLF